MDSRLHGNDVIAFSLDMNNYFKPSFLKIIAAGQKPVNDDCKRLKPIKAVNQTKFGLT